MSPLAGVDARRRSRVLRVPHGAQRLGHKSMLAALDLPFARSLSSAPARDGRRGASCCAVAARCAKVGGALTALLIGIQVRARSPSAHESSRVTRRASNTHAGAVSPNHPIWRTIAACAPASSSVSRTAAASTVSSNSQPPLGKIHLLGSLDDEIIRHSRSPPSCGAARSPAGQDADCTQRPRTRCPAGCGGRAALSGEVAGRNHPLAPHLSAAVEKACTHTAADARTTPFADGTRRGSTCSRTTMQPATSRRPLSSYRCFSRPNRAGLSSGSRE
jgi:hypothetical protein